MPLSFKQSLVILLIVLSFATTTYAEEIVQHNDVTQTFSDEWLELYQLDLSFGWGYVFYNSLSKKYDLTQKYFPVFTHQENEKKETFADRQRRRAVENPTADFDFLFPLNRYFTLGVGGHLRKHGTYVTFIPQVRFPINHSHFSLFINLPIGLGLASYVATVADPNIYTWRNIAFISSLRAGATYRLNRRWGIHFTLGFDSIFENREVYFFPRHGISVFPEHKEYEICDDNHVETRTCLALRDKWEWHQFVSVHASLGISFWY